MLAYCLVKQRVSAQAIGFIRNFMYIVLYSVYLQKIGENQGISCVF